LKKGVSGRIIEQIFKITNSIIHVLTKKSQLKQKMPSNVYANEVSISFLNKT